MKTSSEFRRRRALIVSVCALAGGLVTGCRLKDPPKTAEIQQQGMAHVATPGVWASAPTTPGWTMDNWVQTFNDPQLNALVDEALAYNTDLRVGATRVEQARLSAKLAGAALWPSVDGMARGGGKVSDGSGLTGGAITATWELDLWGRIRYGRAAAAADAASAQADYEFARQAIAATVAKMYMMALEARLQLVTASELLAESEQLVSLADQRLTVGIGDEQDVASARGDVEGYRDIVRQLELALNHAGRGLEAVLGRYPAAAMQFGSPLPTFPGDIPAGLPSELLERRPDVIAAERRVAAAFYRVGEAKAARLPRITLTTGINSISSSLFVLQDRDNPVWSFGAGLLAPLFHGGALKTQVEIRTAEQKQAVAEYAGIGLRAFSDVEEALATELAMRDRERILTTQQVDRQRALDLAQTRYQVGPGDLRAVEQRLIALQANRAALLRVQTEQRVQRINLHLALGGSFGAPTPKS